MLTESLTDKKVKIGELVELGIAGEIFVTKCCHYIENLRYTSN